VAICQNQLRMVPRAIASPLLSVECHWSQTMIEPEPDVVLEHTDYFGNQVVSFAIESLHWQLVVLVRSGVTVQQHQSPDELVSPPWQQVSGGLAGGHDPRWLEIQEFLYDSPRIRRGIGFADYARKSFASGRPVLEAALELTRRIHADFKYDTTATDVNTTTEEAFELRAGVCQDFAHVQIACLRSVGLPARYVSGYLRTVPPPGRTRLVGADQSHAWISVYAGERLGWIDLDPTNACFTDTNHIPICVGRDYSEVSPMRGVVLGGSTTQLKVSVDVEPAPSSDEDMPR
jgi:transglutaminase-like putative cysteine protease